ncbi:MAG TPA: 1-deoxy-D-xylulose-5-phosphate reductoisomerase, partial [Chloroflexota bacterium]|nr:1-deoxy-D-xylulose-5-phosphate reductoisomerase [Chloroflexota bacterium]
AIWQCVLGEPPGAIEKLVLTASGGAFRDLAPAELNNVTPTMALAHPTWRMGPKVTVDSATLMNKGLEVIEATLLFDVPMANVDVLMHRESIVHSLVYFSDSSVKAQLGLPDMRLPIQYALTYPDRWPNSIQRLDLAGLSELHFGAVDWDRYPCLRLAVEAGKKSGTYPTALCAADEIAVELFLGGRIPFTAISNLVEETLSRHVSCPDPTLDDILHADAMARQDCREAAFSGRIGIV